MNPRSVHAVARFGLGQRGTEPPPADPEGWLAAQLEGPDPALAGSRPDIASAFDVWHRHELAGREFDLGKTTTRPLFISERFASDRRWIMHTMIGSTQPFRERMVQFWANHFTVSARAGSGVLTMVAAYMNEAIRPHVTGRFEDMLKAVMHHPAMLQYLNNIDSVGPNSVTGQKLHRGVNENLARECLELHTVGVDGGYSQKDVVSFAKVLTGWSFERVKEPRGFVFKAGDHEPGSKTVMGKSFPEGYEGGVAALTWLAHHPATYRHLATQLVRHFVSDTPDEADVAKVAAVFADTRGDLKAATLAVMRLDGAWKPLTKLRPPIDYVVALYRALGIMTTNPADGSDSFWATYTLGQPVESPLLPNGWADTAAAWAEGESLLRRADLAYDLAGSPGVTDPDGLIGSVGPLLSANTLSIVRGAGSRREALALLLASPEFMRR